MDGAAHTSNSRVVAYDVHSPFYCLRGAVNAILKCLGLDSKADDDSSCSNGKNKSKYGNEPGSCQDQSYSTPEGDGQPMYPHSDPPNDPTLEDLARRGRTPPRPVISGGGPPQTNSNAF